MERLTKEELLKMKEVLRDLCETLLFLVVWLIITMGSLIGIDYFLPFDLTHSVGWTAIGSAVVAVPSLLMASWVVGTFFEYYIEKKEAKKIS